MNRRRPVRSFNCEFGYELIAVLPLAYALHERGWLVGTESARDTRCLYWFSPEHAEKAGQRDGANNLLLAREGYPNADIHRPELDWRYFRPPPLKARYANDRFRFGKPTLVICNRKNREWGGEPINFIPEETLAALFDLLSPRYQIVYCNLDGRPELYDEASPVPMGDYRLIADRYAGRVVSIHDLAAAYPGLSFNTLQLSVFANCERFITMNGGYGILASYFGGTNLIYSRECMEIKPEIDSFRRWYHRFGGSRIVHVESTTRLVEGVEREFVA